MERAPQVSTAATKEQVMTLPQISCAHRLNGPQVSFDARGMAVRVAVRSLSFEGLKRNAFWNCCSRVVQDFKFTSGHFASDTVQRSTSMTG